MFFGVYRFSRFVIICLILTEGILKIYYLTLVLALIYSGCDSKHDDPHVEKSSGEVVSEEIDATLVSKKRYSLEGAESGFFEVSKQGQKVEIVRGETELVLFDFFTTWCPACRAVAPHLGSLQEKYPNDLKIIGVLLEEKKSRKDIRKFKSKYGANYTISIAPDNYKLSNAIASLLRMPRNFSIPLLVMFKDGEYFTHYIGAVPEEMIESDVKEALELREAK
jgi:thiol-disulfide isomerase/thioredoxin